MKRRMVRYTVVTVMDLDPDNFYDIQSILDVGRNLGCSEIVDVSSVDKKEEYPDVESATVSYSK